MSTVVTPFAVVSFSFMFEEYETWLYFVWGRYSLLNQRIWFYGSGPNPFTIFAHPNPTLLILVVFWISCGIVQSAIILYSSRTSHRSLVVWVVAALVLYAQYEFTFFLIGGVIFVAYRIDYILLLPIPSILAIVALMALHQMRKQSTRPLVDSKYASTC